MLAPTEGPGEDLAVRIALGTTAVGVLPDSDPAADGVTEGAAWPDPYYIVIHTQRSAIRPPGQSVHEATFASNKTGCKVLQSDAFQIYHVASRRFSVGSWQAVAAAKTIDTGSAVAGDGPGAVLRRR